MRALARVALLLLLAGCAKSKGPAPASDGPLPTSPAVAVRAAAGDAARGAKLVAELECRRCHEAAVAEQPALEKNCTGCHVQIVEGSFPADEEQLERWQRRIHHFVALPSLAGSGEKLRSSWVARFLLEPHDLRPGLEESMPRFRLTPEQASDIAASIAPRDATDRETPAGNAQRGRELLESKGCGTCHRMSGVAPLTAQKLAVNLDAGRLAKAIRLAPDLALSRELLLPGYVERWLAKPSAVDPNALMPDIPLTKAEARDIAAYVLTAPLAPPAAKQAFQRLPLLTRPVLFAEVKQRVFRNTCWHCHADPDYAIGDGGPGNTGGFGFAGRRINLAEHETVLAGYVDDAGERRSLFLAEAPSGENRLVQALLARHSEEAGSPVAGVRGMPLGLPALSGEEIQLVESWIAQGRPL